MDHIFITTLLPLRGEIGVQTHIKECSRYLNDIGFANQVSEISPYNDFGFLFRLIRKTLSLAFQSNQEMYILTVRKLFYIEIKKQIIKKARTLTGIKKIIYAQDPLSAKIGLELRGKNIVDEVVLAVHFNISEAWEILSKGFAKPNGLLVRYFNNLEMETIPFVDRIIFVSKYMEGKVLERMMAINKNNCRVIPNFISYLEADESAEIYGDLITIGTIEPRKNQEYIIRIMNEIIHRGYLCNLTIVGDGPDRLKIENMVEELGLKKHIKFIGSKPEAVQLIKHHKVYVHTAKMENLPITIIEALSVGKPIFAFPVGGIPELFEDGVEGYYLSGDVKVDADKLITILSNSELLESLSRRAKETSKKFDPKNVGPEWIKFVLGKI